MDYMPLIFKTPPSPWMMTTLLHQIVDLDGVQQRRCVAVPFGVANHRRRKHRAAREDSIYTASPIKPCRKTRNRMSLPLACPPGNIAVGCRKAKPSPPTFRDIGQSCRRISGKTVVPTKTRQLPFWCRAPFPSLPPPP